METSIMMKFNVNCMKLMKQFYSKGKWNVPKELLSTSISETEKLNKPQGRSKTMEQLLKKRFPKAENITVTDLSGNCGSMYEVVVVSEEFKELPLVKQHMLVTEVLSNHIKNMHGIRIETQVPETTGKSPS